MNETSNNNNNTLSPPHTRSDNNGSGNSNINRNTNDTYVSTNQTSTPNQIPPLNQTLRENQLSETTSLEDVAHIRVVNKNGASQKIAHNNFKQNITPSTTEQLTGEYFSGSNGTRKPVYVKLIDMTSKYAIVHGSSLIYTVPFYNLAKDVDDFICCNGTIILDISNPYQYDTNCNISSREFVISKYPNSIIHSWFRYDVGSTEKYARLCVVLKYTKL